MQQYLEKFGRAMPVVRQGAKRVALRAGVEVLDTATSVTDTLRSVGRIENLVSGRKSSLRVDLLDLGHQGLTAVSDRVRAAAGKTVQL